MHTIGLVEHHIDYKRGSNYVPTAKRFLYPRQLALFTKTPEPIPIGVYIEPDEEETIIDEGLSIVKNGNSSQLIISGAGVTLGRKNDRIIIVKGNKVIYEFLLSGINEVVISSKGISIASELITELCQRGIAISFLSYTGRPCAMITSPMLMATNLARREQLLAFNDYRGLEFSRIMLSAKLRNQERLLLFFNKSLLKQGDKVKKDPIRWEKIRECAKAIKELRYNKTKQIEGERLDQVRGLLAELDMSASQSYEYGLKEIINFKFEFLGHVHTRAGEIIKALLNYGYGLLYTQVWAAIMKAGLEPFAGFRNLDQPGQPSLVIDLIEEFRQPVVDRTIISEINLGEVHRMEKGILVLDNETRKVVGQKILQRLESVEIYQGREYQIRSIIQIQARKLADFFLGEGKYSPFLFRW